MSSAKRIAANIANAQKSTGPTTPQGKAHAAQNSTKHGLTANTVVLPHESNEEYVKLHNRFINHYDPDSDFEYDLLCRMVDCWWKLQRAQRVEAEFLSSRAGDRGIADMIDDEKESAKLRLLMRYLGAAERSWRYALAEYTSITKARAKSEPSQSERFEALLNAPLPQLPPLRMPDGFVSQNNEPAQTPTVGQVSTCKSR